MTARHGGGRDRLLRCWIVAFLGVLAVTAAWSLATPLGSAPDEPSHLDAAAALVRGELVGRPAPPTATGYRGARGSEERAALHIVRVPKVFANLPATIRCFQFRAVPAGCAPPFDRSTATVPVFDYTGQYPPVYGTLVGLPTLLAVSVEGIRLARLASCALASALLALSACCARRTRGSPLIAAGLAVGVTPMVLYLASTINPNGFEAAAAAAAWAAALSLRSQPAAKVRPFDVAALGAALAATAVSRSIGFLWVAAVVVLLVLLPPGGWRDLLRRRDVRAWALVDALAVVATVGWDLAEHGLAVEPGAPVAGRPGELALASLVVRHLPGFVTNSIGQFGWETVRSPWLVLAAFACALGGLAYAALAAAPRRWAPVAVGMPVAWVLLAVGTDLALARTHGLEVQGRYFLGLAVGIPMVWAAAVGPAELTARTARRLAAALVATAMGYQLVDLYWGLRAFTVGGTGPLDLFARVPGRWVPPVAPAVLLVLAAAGLVAFGSQLRGAPLRSAGPAAAALPATAGGPPR